MPYRHGTVVWRELVTGDASAAEKFYASVFSWRVSSPVPTQCGTYRMVEAAGVEVAGIFEMPTSFGIPVHWSPSVSVGDVDAATQLAKASGAQIAMEPIDIPNLGRKATILPPTGGAFSLFKSETGDIEREKPRAGEFCWEQLNSANVTSEKAFYGRVLGWKVELFAESNLEIFTSSEGGVASLVPAPNGTRSHWLSHIVVESLQEVRQRIVKSGGTVLVEQIDMPRLGAFGVAQDPEGAKFCVFESVDTLA